jgi:hypothetical protein
MYTHRDLCRLTAAWILQKPGIDLACYEMRWNKGLVDVIGLSSSERCKNKRLIVIEVKRTRSDLLQDLRKKKLCKYESKATHCYLAATAEALQYSNINKTKILNDLRKKGLPVQWGVILLPTKASNQKPRVLSNPRKMRPAHSRTLKALIRKIARSYMYRVLSDTSPMSKEISDL